MNSLRQFSQQLFKFIPPKFRLIALFCSIFCSFILILFIGINIFCVQNAQNRNFNDNEIEQIIPRQAALILGCRIGSGLLHWRIEAGAQLYHQGKVKFLIVSGDNSRKDYNEPDYMKEQLIQMGVPAHHIFCDYAGFRTLDSIIRCQYIFSQEDFIIVSQKWHNYRALMIAQHYKMKNVIAFNAKTCYFYRYFPEPPRESLARFLAFLDLYIIKRKPKFYGKKINLESK